MATHIVKLCWLSQITSSSYMSLNVASRSICSVIFPGTDVKLTGLVFPGSFYFPFLKIRVTFTFFLPPGTSPDSHNFSNTMESGLLATSVSSFSTLVCISSSLTDLFTFRLMGLSQTCSALTVRGTLLPQIQAGGSGTWKD